MKRSFKIKVPIYGFSLFFSFKQKNKELKKSIPSHYVKESLCIEEAFGICTYLDTGLIVVRMRELPITAKYKGYLAHEIYHAVCYILRRVSIPYGAKSEEAFAYLISYITEQVYKQLEKNKK